MSLIYMITNKMEITLAVREDLKEILALQKLVYMENAERYNNYTIPPLVETIEEMENVFTFSRFLKVVENGKIIGSMRAYAKEGTCYIGRVAVHLDFRDKGIGRQMMGRMESLFPDVKRFELFTGIKDEKNLHFYAKLGYTKFQVPGLDPNLVCLEKIQK